MKQPNPINWLQTSTCQWEDWMHALSDLTILSTLLFRALLCAFWNANRNVVLNFTRISATRCGPFRIVCVCVNANIHVPVVHLPEWCVEFWEVEHSTLLTTIFTHLMTFNAQFLSHYWQLWVSQIDSFYVRSFECVPEEISAHIPNWTPAIRLRTHFWTPL